MIYVIEKTCLDYLENRAADAITHRPFAYTEYEKDAKHFCEREGLYTVADCWAIGSPIPKYRYNKLNDLTTHLRENPK